MVIQYLWTIVVFCNVWKTNCLVWLYIWPEWGGAGFSQQNNVE